MLKILAVACATDDSRPILTGVACKDGEMASADGFRLVNLKDNRLNFGLGDKQAIIPLDTIVLIQRLFSKEESLDIAFETTPLRRVYIKSGDTFLLSELVQGTYPNYEQLIPHNFTCKVSFSAPLLSQRLKLINIKDITSGTVKYHFRKTNEDICSINTTAYKDTLNSYSMSLPVKIEGVGAKIAFQYVYILEALKHLSICNLELTSPSSPGKITSDIEGLTIVVMPMFAQWDDND